MLSRYLHQEKYIRLSHTSSEDVFKMYWSRRMYLSWTYVFKPSLRHFQDVFKTSSRHLAKTSSRRLQDVFKTSCKNVVKTSSRSLAKTSWIHLKTSWDVFKTYCKDVLRTSSGRFKDAYQVKVLVNTSSRRLRDVFNMFLRQTVKTIIYRKIWLGHTSEKFMVSVQNFQEWTLWIYWDS